MRYDQKLITDENIRIDEDEFSNCTFLRCRVIFTGKGPRFTNCTFHECQWVFDAAAEDTIQYLAALYTGLGSGGQDLVEGIFDSIRRGGVGHGTLISGPPAEALRR